MSAKTRMCIVIGGATGITEDGCLVCPECAEGFRDEGFEVVISYEREWADRRNAAGFAAACARLALPFYEGDCRSNLVAAIELAERYAGGGNISSAYVHASVTTRNRCARSMFPSARCAAYAAYAALGSSTGSVARAANAAGHAGADEHDIIFALARWVVRDLSRGRELPVLLRQAAGAAVVAGDEALAWEIITRVNRSETRSVSET